MLFLGLDKQNVLTRTLISLCALLVFLVNQTAAAGSGRFFNISATGTASRLSITLCLIPHQPVVDY